MIKVCFVPFGEDQLKNYGGQFFYAGMREFNEVKAMIESFMHVLFLFLQSNIYLDLFYIIYCTKVSYVVE